MEIVLTITSGQNTSLGLAEQIALKLQAAGTIKSFGPDAATRGLYVICSSQMKKFVSLQFANEGYEII